MKVLLLNPPGTRTYLRDYYCSKVSKAAYLYHPTDLLILSGIVAERHEVAVIDAIAENLSVVECLSRILDYAPEAVISLCGAVSWPEDRAFFGRLKESLPSVRLVLTGDLVLEGAIDPLKQVPVIDALLLDFISPAVLEYLEGGKGERIPNVAYRMGADWVTGDSSRPVGQSFAFPVPRYALFPEKRYRFPFVNSRHFATVLTDYGCPHRCRFCVMGNLGFQWRTVDNVLQELDWLKGQSYRELYFNDQTFGANRERTEKLLKAMIECGYGFGWVCWSRVDVVDESLLEMMKEAGCHTIMFGAESGDDEVLRAARKGFDTGKVREVFRLCRKIGLRTVATFMIGLPGQDAISCRDTIDYAKSCGCDFASFNIPVPRMTTDLRRQALEKGWIEDGDLTFDQSGDVPAMDNGVLSAKEIYRLRQQALREFYLRPGYLAGRLGSVRSFGELWALAKFGLATLR